MAISGAAATHHSFLPWDTDDGMPPRIFHPDNYPVSTGIAVRSGPDGAWQLWVKGSRAVHLRGSYGRADVRLDGYVPDGVLHPDGSATILEVVRSASREAVLAHHVGAESSGRRSLDLTEICAAAGHRIVNESRLINDELGRTYYANDDLNEGILVRVDDGSGQVITTWPHSYGPPFDCRGGALRIIRYRGGGYDLVIHDLDSGTETRRTVGKDGRALVCDAVGMDDADRIYGHADVAYVPSTMGVRRWGYAPLLGREDPDGHTDWLVMLGGIAVSDQHDVALLALDRDGTGTLLLPGGDQVAVEDTPATRGARLAGHDGAGGYLLHQHKEDKWGNRPGNGTLIRLDRNGRVKDTEPARRDVYLTSDTTPLASKQAVTTEGEVLLPVLSPSGVHVVSVGPPR